VQNRHWTEASSFLVVDVKKIAEGLHQDQPVLAIHLFIGHQFFFANDEKKNIMAIQRCSAQVVVQDRGESQEFFEVVELHRVPLFTGLGKI
jgi:hypothetical protein